jgi:hypothetical protein
MQPFFNISIHCLRSIRVAVVLFIVLLLSFSLNLLGIAPPHIWNNWQLVGQARVVGGIVADERNLDKDGAQLGEVYLPSLGDNVPDPQYLTAETYRTWADPSHDQRVLFYPYRAQLGLQGTFYSWFSRRLGLRTLKELQWLPAGATAMAVSALFLLFRRIFNLSFSCLFVASLALSPFFTAMARNIYWNPVLFFLPTLSACWMYLDRRPFAQASALFMVALTMFLKAGSNYEFLTSVTVLASSVFLVGPFFSANGNPKPDWDRAFLVGAACILGFLAALFLHADARGAGSISEGLRLIFEQDISRRTFGDPARFSGETAQSLNVSVFSVLRLYFYDKYPHWREMLIPAKLFLVLICVAIAGLVHKGLTRHPMFQRDLYLFFVFLSVPVSWFVMAKGHSFTQTHINFVLWFIGFMPALIFVAASGLLVPLTSLLKRSN